GPSPAPRPPTRTPPPYTTLFRSAALETFLREQIAAAKEQGVLFSLHLKATMMKVSDPILFGHAVRAFFPTLFTQYGDVLAEAGLDRKSTRLNSSHVTISHAVFCL